MRSFSLFALILILPVSPYAAVPVRAGIVPQAKQAKAVSLERIWDRASHNSGPTLTRYQNRFFLAFREGSSQVIPDGTIRVLSSLNGSEWRSQALLTANGDLRQPKLTVLSSDQLLLTAELKIMRPPDVEYQTVRWTSRDGVHWSESTQAAELNFVLGQPVVRGSSTFAIGARQFSPFILRLYGGPGDMLKKVYQETLYSADHPSEGTLLFTSPQNALSIVRCEIGPHRSMLGSSKAPFRHWAWKDLGADLSDAMFLQLNPQQILVGAKSLQPKQQTILSQLDLKKGKLQELLTLPSGGDTGSPSMVFHNGFLWVAYHSSHFRITSIWFAKIKLP